MGKQPRDRLRLSLSQHGLGWCRRELKIVDFLPLAMLLPGGLAANPGNGQKNNAGKTMNDDSRAAAENGGSNMASEGQMSGTADSGTGTGAASMQDSIVAAADLARAPVAVRLRAAREALGLTTGDVASRTRITLRHIEALESGDYAALPGRPYALGFARAYALAVGLAGTAIADAVRSELQGSAPRPEPRVLHQFEVGDPAKTPSRLVGWLALLLVAAILAMGAVFWRSYYAPAVALPSLAGPAELTIKQGKPAGITMPAQAKATAGGAVIFTAMEAGIWVKFYDGQGRQLMQKQLAKGENYTVPADAEAPKLWTGRPDALAITIGGQGISRLADAEKIMKDVPVDAPSLRARSQAPVAAATKTAAGPANGASPAAASRPAAP